MGDDYTLTPVAHDPFADPTYAQHFRLPDPADIARAPTLSAYTPSLSERMGAAAQSALESMGASRGYAQGFGHRLQDVAGLVPGVGQAMSAYDAGRAGAGGDYSGAALAALGALPMAGAAAREVEGEAPRIIAYHGSPHSFDKFDLSKIGTGEGAQAYGHGLYFADNEGVAKSYRDTLRKGVDYQGAGYPGGDTNPAAKQVADRITGPEVDPADAIAQTHAAFINAANQARKFGGSTIVGEANLRRADHYQALADQIKALNPKDFSFTPGSMYQVAINANPDHFLDWDKPVGDQHPTVKAAIDEAFEPHAGPGYTSKENLSRRSPQAALMDLAHPKWTGNHANASAALQQAGIPGIKYLDQGSRTSGDGSRNYVLFSDHAIQILKKYGIAGLMGTVGLSAGAHVALTPVDNDPFSGATQ